MKTSGILVGLLLIIGSLHAQIEQTNLLINERLDLVFNNFCTDNNIRGLSASVNLGSENIWNGVHGESYERVLVDTNTMFMNAIGAAYTATIILQLAEESKLNLSDSIHKFLPAFNNVDSTITIDQCLGNKTGLYNYISNPALESAMYDDPGKNWTPEELLGYLGPPTGVPGTTSYNTGYILLGMIIEAITGNSLGSEFESRIFIPCNLKRTIFLPDQTMRNEVAHPWEGNTDVSSQLNTSSFYSVAWNLDGFVGTSKDNADFLKHLLYEKTLLNENSVQMMLDYSYGIFDTPNIRYHDPATLEYGYSLLYNMGGVTAINYIPEDSLFYSICSNDSKFRNDNLRDGLRKRLQVAVRNLSPSDISFPVDTIPYDLEVNQNVGLFTSVDTNYYNSQSDFTYSLVAGDGVLDKDNSCFKIFGRSLRLLCELNAEQSEYHILVKSEDGCGGAITKPFVLYAESTVDVEDRKSFQQLSYYPNPARDVLNIELDQTESSEVSVALYDLTGRQVYSDYHTTTVGKNNMTIDVSDLAKGVYLLDIQQGNKLFLKKILIH